MCSWFEEFIADLGRKNAVLLRASKQEKFTVRRLYIKYEYLSPLSLSLTADADPGAKRRLDGHAGDVDDHAHIGAAPAAARHFTGGVKEAQTKGRPKPKELR